MRAAQYVRMSTELQQYSIENQTSAISEYAKSHDFEVVRTYSDQARSGIDLAGEDSRIRTKALATNFSAGGLG